MSTVQIRRQKDTTQVTRLQLGLLDEHSHDLVNPGDVVEVPADIAGEAPFWRPVTDDDLAPNAPIRETRQGDDGIEVRDLGHGLLSQEGNWEPVEQPEPKKTATKAKKPADTGSQGE